MRSESKRVREKATVRLDSEDSGLLRQVVEATGLRKAEILRRALRRFAEVTLPPREAGSALEYLVATATDDAFPSDVAARHDYYLYEGGYHKTIAVSPRDPVAGHGSPRPSPRATRAIDET